MPRHAFVKLLQLTLCMVLLTLNARVFAAPAPIITVMSTQGMAPFTVHAHCVNSTYTTGDRLSSLLEWDFGDPNGPYNKLHGFNAAHTYDQPGTYTLKLSITDKNGAKVTATKQITVTAANRGMIYVSAAGNDNNSGTSTSSPIKTMAKAAQLISNNKAILLRRGDTFNLSSQFQITQSNLLIGAYGSGNRPILKWVGGGPYAAIIDMGDEADGIVIENLVLDGGSSPPNQSSARGVHLNGQNSTIRDCHFEDVSDALNSANECLGLLAMDNTAEILSGYFIWGNGADHTFLGNVVDGSINEHVIRIANVDRLLIAQNDLTNDAKSTIWCMLGNDAYLANNKIHDGRILTGPNFASGSSSERFRRVVAEGNEIFDEGFILYSGSEKIVLRNNVMHANGKQAFSVWGYLQSMNRTVDDVRIYNNTVTNNSDDYGQFLDLGDGALNLSVINNLYIAPELNTAWSAKNVSSDDSNLNTHSFHHNMWSLPNPGTYVHFVNSNGYTASQWENLSQCSNEMYRDSSPFDFDQEMVPQFNVELGQAIAGMFNDYYGNPRPSGGAWSLGAVEAGSPGPNPDPGPGLPGDVNGDGTVGSGDLTILMADWGTCPAPCAADLNGDGKVNVNDLLFLLNHWT